MEIKVEYKGLNNTNYGSNYEEIFKDSGQELNKHILAIQRLDIYRSSKSFNEMDYKNGNKNFFQSDIIFNTIGRHSHNNTKSSFY